MDTLSLILVTWMWVAAALASTCVPKCCPHGFDYTQEDGCVERAGQLVPSLDPSGCSSWDFMPQCLGKEKPRIIFNHSAKIEMRKVTKRLYKVETVLKKDGLITSFVRTNGKNETSTFSSFCVASGPTSKSGQVQLVACSKITRLKSAEINKCCPFGQNLQYDALGFRPAKLDLEDAFSCIRSKANEHKNWHLTVNGFKLPLQDLIQFPYANVIFNLNEVPVSCNAKFEGRKSLAADLETFSIDEGGNLMQSAISLDEPIAQQDFCVDLVTVKGKGSTFMAALFCTSKDKLEPGSIEELMEDLTSGCCSTVAKIGLLSFIPTLLVAIQQTIECVL